jgi:hypothetical protein
VLKLQLRYGTLSAKLRFETLPQPLEPSSMRKQSFQDSCIPKLELRNEEEDARQRFDSPFVSEPSGVANPRCGCSQTAVVFVLL